MDLPLYLLPFESPNGTLHGFIPLKDLICVRTTGPRDGEVETGWGVVGFTHRDMYVLAQGFGEEAEARAWLDDLPEWVAVVAEGARGVIGWR